MSGTTLPAVRNHVQTSNAEVMAPIVRYQGNVVEQRGGRDPGVGTFDPASGGLAGYGHFRPLAAKVGAGRNNRESVEIGL